MVEFVEAPGLKSDSECEDRAEDILERMSRSGLDASFECLPIPHLEEGDMVRLKSDGFHVKWPLTQFTIPLTAEDSMSIGFNKRPRAKHHRKKHKNNKNKK